MFVKMIRTQRRAATLAIALAFSVLAVERPALGQSTEAGEHWLGTWYASSTARVDQPEGQTQTTPAGTNGQPFVIPPAVLAVAPRQELPVGTQSALHFNNQTLRQIAHITLGGSRFRVVLSPDHLARRLANAGIRMAVLNAGIGGNRVLLDGNGPSALARFDRDVIAQTGVTHVIVLEGINDIGRGQNTSPTAAELIGAHRQMIARAHSRGIKVYGATLTPFEGANYWTPEGEAKRQALNEWIRTSKAYDAVFDFDAAVRDPSRPTKTLAEYDPGDHLHLNAAGYQAMANTIDLTLFRLR
jgi:lysophospholipase L1-like esterase